MPLRGRNRKLGEFLMRRLNSVLVVAVAALVVWFAYLTGYNRGHSDGYVRGRMEHTTNYLRNPWQYAR
jgi:hypothetical protein